MIAGWRSAVTIGAIVGSGLMAGLFLAYSTFTMTGIRRLPPATAMRTMQSINRAADTSPALMIVMFGTAVACVVLSISSLRHLAERAHVLIVVASVLYLLGVVGMTMGYHVPRNQALGLLDADAPGAADAWRSYASAWVAWNHVRTLAPVASMISFAVALR